MREPVILWLAMAVATGNCAKPAASAGLDVAAAADVHAEAEAPKSDAADAKGPVDVSSCCDVSYDTIQGPETGQIADADTPTVDVASATDADTVASDIAQPSPLLVSGQFVDHWAEFGVKLPTSPADKGKFVEASSSAGALGDLDQDGVYDLVVVDGISNAWWGRGLKGFKFYDSPLYTAKELGLRSICLTDVDADGYPEIALGGGKLSFLVRTKNETYNDEASYRGLQASKQAHTQHIATADLDSDGLLDLVTVEYSCSDQAQVRGFLNQGNGTYADDTYALGIGHKTTAWFALPFDDDGDGHIDLFVGHENCEAAHGNIYYRNKGPLGDPPRFMQIKIPPIFLAPAAGGATPMGGSAADFDMDGDLDLILSATGLSEMQSAGIKVSDAMKDPALANPFVAASNSLLLRQADGSYKLAGPETLLGFAVSETGKTMVSWSMRALDFDADGWPDILATHGDDAQSLLLADEGGQRPVLFRNLGTGQFEDVSAKFALPSQHMGRSLSVADIDFDGDLDFLAGGQGTQPLLAENQIAPPKHWLQVRLRGKASNVWGVGALVELHTTGKTLVYAMGASAPTQTQDPMVAPFVWPDAWQPTQLVVHWPSGYQQVVGNVPQNQMITLQEPPLVQLSARFVLSSNPQATVKVAAQAFDANGQPQAGVATTIELGPGAKGSWQGPTECSAGGLCERTWKVPPMGWGSDAVAVAFGGQALKVRPLIRFDKSQ